jgi:hypothetical protein
MGRVALAGLAAGTLLFAAAGCVPGSSGGGGKAESLVIASWNVQALFDGKDSGNEYGDYRADAGWTEEKYRSRLNAVASAVQAMAAKDSGAEKDSGGSGVGAQRLRRCTGPRQVRRQRQDRFRLAARCRGAY